jgi:protein required for attachment to host cells
MMQVPHNAFVVVADGRKMLFLRNEGDAEHPNLQVERKRVQDNPDNHEQSADVSGRAQSTRMEGGTFAAGGGTMENADFHQIEEDRFAADTAELLNKRALNNDFESLIIVAPPGTLGELRKHYHKEVENRLAGEIDKDLTRHTIAEIEQALIAA